LSIYYEQNHQHKGVGSDGSSKISYNDLEDIPESGGLTEVATDATLSGDGTSGDPLSVEKLATARTIALTGDVTGSTTFDGSGDVSIATTGGGYSPTLGSEVTVGATTVSASLTVTIDIEGAVTTHSNGQYALVKFERGASTLTTTLYLIPAITGAESGSASWPEVCLLPSGGRVVLMLPIGRYRAYLNVTGGGISFNYSIKYKIVNSLISYT
jgi:hypothetical protein